MEKELTCFKCLPCAFTDVTPSHPHSKLKGLLEPSWRVVWCNGDGIKQCLLKEYLLDLDLCFECRDLLLLVPSLERLDLHELNLRGRGDIRMQLTVEQWSPSYKMMYNNLYSWPSASIDFQLWIENNVFDLLLVVSEDAKPRDMGPIVYLLTKVGM